MSNFLVLGGTYLDEIHWLSNRIDFDITLRVHRSERTLGGPGLCAATALRRLGNPVTLHTSLGTCADSARARLFLAGEGIELSPWTRSHDGALDRGTTLMDPTGRSVVYTRRSIPAPDAGAVPIPGDAVTVVCSPTPLAPLLSKVDEFGCVVLNLHAGQCRELAGMAAADRRALLGAVRLLVLNEHEFALLHGIPELARLPVVVVTRGADGSTLLTPSGPRHFPAYPNAIRRPANTNGAGEAFLAALLTARDGDVPWPDAIRTAAQHAWRHIRDADSLAFPVTTTAAPSPEYDPAEDRKVVVAHP